jgi:hypothetical protein
MIIGNKHSYDSRQYPTWLDPRYEPGKNTPEGQAFGHTLVISKKRIFNVVDPDATANDCERIKEMKQHFSKFWEESQGWNKIIQHAKKVFDDQNKKLMEKAPDKFEKISLELSEYFESSQQDFTKLKAHDFEYAFHPFPENSVGEIHMHVIAKKPSLRLFSAKRHDQKTIPLDVILEAEAEDKEKAKEQSWIWSASAMIWQLSQALRTMF